MTITTDQLRTIAGSSGNVLSSDGGKIGGIGQVYVDDVTGEPTWVTAKTGLFGTKESFVPLAGANVQGDDVVVNYDEARVKGAPRVDADGNLSPEEEDELYNYYGLGNAGTTGVETGTTTGADYATTDTTTTGTTTGADYATSGTATTGYSSDRDTVGRDTSGPTTDDAMTRSEERLRVGVQQREAGRVRLRKYIVSEQVTQTVPVRHEEVRLEREPITDANVGAATSGPNLSEEEHEVVLHEEVAVVDKETVPVERVRLDTETVVEQQQVTEEVRKEQIVTEGGTDTTGRNR